MTVVCDFVGCQFNVNHFCSQKLLSIHNGYCLNLIDKHGNPKNDWTNSIDKKYKEEVKLEDGEYRAIEIIKDNSGNSDKNDDKSKDDGCANQCAKEEDKGS